MKVFFILEHDGAMAVYDRHEEVAPHKHGKEGAVELAGRSDFICMAGVLKHTTAVHIYFVTNIFLALALQLPFHVHCELIQQQ